MFHGELARHPIPTVEEQIELGRCIRRWLDHPGGEDAAPKAVQRSGKAALDRLVSGNLRLVLSMASGFFSCAPLRMDQRDLVSVGVEGLIRAARKFDPERGYRFSTYATWWIRQAMQRESRAGGLIRTPDNVGELAVRAKAVSGRLLGELGRQPTLEEVAAEIGGGVTVERVREVLEAWSRTTPFSVNAMVRNADDLEIISGVGTESDGWEMAERDETVRRVQQALELLDSDSQQLVRAVYLEGRTMRDVARELKITGEGVRLRLNKAKAALRLALADKRPAIP